MCHIDYAPWQSRGVTCVILTLHPGKLGGVKFPNLRRTMHSVWNPNQYLYILPMTRRCTVRPKKLSQIHFLFFVQWLKEEDEHCPYGPVLAHSPICWFW